MTTENVGSVVVENVDEGRFELVSDGELISFASYFERNGDVLVTHVQTLPPYRDRGNADRLMAGLLDLLRSTDRTITPRCFFAVDYMAEHPDQRNLLTGSGAD